jgi:hypothetical protein
MKRGWTVPSAERAVLILVLYVISVWPGAEPRRVERVLCGQVPI